MATASLPNPHHRKIELQSPLDLTHLQTQLTTSARQKLDLHFPPSAIRSKPATHISLGAPDPAETRTTSNNPTSAQTGTAQADDDNDEETDPLRQHVHSLLTTFLHRTWSAAAQSITINGLDAHTTLPQFSSHTPNTTNPSGASNLPNQSTTTTSQQAKDQEQEGTHYTLAPYDARLQTRLAALYGELESLTAQVSKLRREAPARGAENLKESLLGEIQREDSGFEEAMQVDNDGVEHDQRDSGWGTKHREGWYEEVKGGYENAVRELARLSGHQLPVGEDGSVAVGSGHGGGGSGTAAGGGGGLTGCVGKVQRARTVAEELE